MYKNSYVVNNPRQYTCSSHVEMMKPSRNTGVDTVDNCRQNKKNPEQSSFCLHFRND